MFLNKKEPLGEALCVVFSLPVRSRVFPLRVEGFDPFYGEPDRMLNHFLPGGGEVGKGDVLGLELDLIPIENHTHDILMSLLGDDIEGHAVALEELNARFFIRLHACKDSRALVAQAIYDDLQSGAEVHDAEILGEDHFVKSIQEGSYELDAR